MNSINAILPVNLVALAGRINAEYDAAASSAKTALAHAAACGAMLTEAKAEVPHGQWGDWLEANFRGSDRTAREWMRLAQGMPALKTAESADLSIRGALELLAEPKRPKHPPAPDDGTPIPYVGAGEGPVPADEMGDFIAAVEHATGTPTEIRARLAAQRERNPDVCTPEEWERLEREFVANAWDGLVIGWLNVRMWQGIDADPTKRPDLREYLYEATKGETGARGFWRLRSDVNAYRRYRDSGVREADEPNFPKVLESWASLPEEVGAA